MRGSAWLNFQRVVCDHWWLRNAQGSHVVLMGDAGSRPVGLVIGALVLASGNPFLVFVVATAEIALAIPIVLLLVRFKRSMDIDRYSDLKG